MATPLRRLLPYHDRYKVLFWGGMCGLLAARVFEATIPLFLRDGIDRSIELEWLARPMGGAERPPSGRVRVYDAERRAMEQLDIPHFTLDEWRAMGHTIADPDLFLLGVERDSHLLRRRLARLGRDDHRVQRSIIVSAIDARYPGGSGAHGSIS